MPTAVKDNRMRYDAAFDAVVFGGVSGGAVGDRGVSDVSSASSAARLKYIPIFIDVSMLIYNSLSLLLSSLDADKDDDVDRADSVSDVKSMYPSQYGSLSMHAL